jgi:hypothetical protein
MTNEEMQETAEYIAKESPNTLLKALRDNGFWMYAIHKTDVAEALNGSSDLSDTSMLPITDDDMHWVNEKGYIEDTVNYGDIMHEILHRIRCKRIAMSSE